MTNRAMAIIITGFLLLSPTVYGQENQDVSEEDGEICYNMVTHTITAGASFAECMAYAYYVDADFNGMTFTGCYNMVSHVPDPTVNQTVCEAYAWVPAVNIAMTAQATTIHNSLVAALAQAELVATLQGAGPFTVFAPTDAAFAEAGIDLASLDTEDGKATLTDILTYHVVVGSVNSSSLTDGMTVAAYNGDDLTFSVGEGVKVNDANVTLADVPASNGVIHVIDKVLMPPADEPVIPEGCDYVIGIDDTGFAYDNADLSIEVGETVCWDLERRIDGPQCCRDRFKGGHKSEDRWSIQRPTRGDGRLQDHIRSGRHFPLHLRAPRFHGHGRSSDCGHRCRTTSTLSRARGGKRTRVLGRDGLSGNDWSSNDSIQKELLIQ